MKKLIAISIFCFLGGTFVFGQESPYKCGTYTAQEQVFKMYPELEEAYYANQLLQNSKVSLSGNGNIEKWDSINYNIPVVFHILHMYGSENISDAQVYDCMRVLNEEFNAADPDSVDVVAEFDSLIGNAHIYFKLASKDPYGNCTNGIEHIYSHETNMGDAFSKLHQWNRSHYMNVWVVDVVGVPGAAAYATSPGGTDGSGFWVDGALSRHTYVGSIGTSSPGVESVITHELAHWLNVAHTFGSSDLINDGPTICNDDGVLDTPPTRGHLNCPAGYPATWIDCDTAGIIVEDVQNYMDYSYCDRHFTPGQVEVMHNALLGIAGQRNILYQDSTLMATGIDLMPNPLITPQVPTNDLANLTVPLCAPVADFNSSTRQACVNQSITFYDASWNAVIGNRTWTFPGGTPSTSTLSNPTVTYDTEGPKTVILTVSNDAGSGTETRAGYIHISPEWADFTGPAIVDLEGGSANWFLSNNFEENHAKFLLSSGTGYNGSRSYKLNNYKDVANADDYTDDYFYNSRLGGSVDELISPSYDLRYTTGVTASFRFSYATNATSEAGITEMIKVYSSTDCGVTWTARQIKVNGMPLTSPPQTELSNADIVTGGFAGYADYVPTSNNDWATASVNYTPTAADDHTRFKIEFTASDNSSNLYIDEFSVNGTLGLVSDEVALLDLNVFPNPLSNGSAINVSYTAQNEPVTFTLRDTQGKVIATEVLAETNTLVNHTLNNTNNLQSACYFLEVQTAGHTTVRKVVVL